MENVGPTYMLHVVEPFDSTPSPSHFMEIVIPVLQKKTKVQIGNEMSEAPDVSVTTAVQPQVHTK